MKRLFLLIFIFGNVCFLSFSQSVIIKDYDKNQQLEVNEFVLPGEETELSTSQGNLFSIGDSVKILYGLTGNLLNISNVDSSQTRRINYVNDSSSDSTKLFRIETFNTIYNNLSGEAINQEETITNIIANRKRWIKE
jgi:hypothetical protein